MVVLLEKIFLSHLRLRHIFITLEQPEIESLSSSSSGAAHSPASHSAIESGERE
jgi:hypothetical protein